MTEETEFAHLSDEDFRAEAAELLKEFMNSDEQEKHLPAMNSYYRRLTHKLATSFGLDTRSEGEDKDRHIVVTKTPDSKIPEALPQKKVILWHFGDREFFVDPMQSEVEVYLSADGTVGVWEEDAGIKALDRKLVTTGSFKIKRNQIIEIHHPEW